MAQSETLVLLRPEDLTSSYQLSGSKNKLCKVLNLLEKALAETSPQHALFAINQALETLATVEVIGSGEILSTNTSLEPWAIDDYDHFFCLEHVQVKEPAECLVKSVLTAYRALLEINQSISLESAKVEVETQKIGLKSCVSLLARAFNLSLEQYHD